MSPDQRTAMTSRSPSVVAGAAIHPAFLRVGPWAPSIVVASLFGLSFATSYAALYDYARQLSREFAIAFALVLNAVLVVLAVTLLLERALGRRAPSQSMASRSDCGCPPGHS